MGYVLKKEVQVAGADDGELRTIDKGTALESIPETELHQLCHEHFVDADGAPMPADAAGDHLGKLAADAAVIAAAEQAAQPTEEAT